MANRTITFELRIDGELTDADTDTVKLSNTAGTIGVKRNDTDAVVVADDTDFTGHPSTGVYTYTFAEPADGLAYTAYIEWQYDGVTYRDSDILAAVSSDDVNWLKVRLPDGYDFSRNGVTITMDEAIAAALELHADKACPLLWAASDLWDAISTDSTSTEGVESETIGGVYSVKLSSGAVVTPADQAAKYRKQAQDCELASGSSEENTFQMATGTYRSQRYNRHDEYTA
jgi:hypothetical protein